MSTTTPLIVVFIALLVPLVVIIVSELGLKSKKASLKKEKKLL